MIGRNAVHSPPFWRPVPVFEPIGRRFSGKSSERVRYYRNLSSWLAARDASDCSATAAHEIPPQARCWQRARVRSTAAIAVARAKIIEGDGAAERGATSVANQRLAPRCGGKGAIAGQSELAPLPAPQDLLAGDDAASLLCDRCGAPFNPHRSSGGSRQRFCTTSCRLTFHRERLRSQRTAPYAGPTTSPAAVQPAPNEEPGGAEDGFVLMNQQDGIEVARDQHGNLRLRQNGCGQDYQELRVCRDYFPHFLKALDKLRQVIADAIHEEGTL
jgi:hypothetical protein